MHTEGANIFSMTDAIGGNSDVTIITTTNSSGGKDKEGIEIIKTALC